jgi:RNA polymerase sigma-B factor
MQHWFAAEPGLCDQDLLIETHLPLVRALARKHVRSGEPLEDLQQCAAEGLVKAAQRYDRRRGVPFAAYAIGTAAGELRRHLRDRAATVRVPRRDQQVAVRVRQARAELTARERRAPSTAELAREAGLSEADVARALVPAGTAPLVWAENVASVGAEEDLAACERRALLQEATGVLDERERAVVELRFRDGLTQAEIARRLHVSQSQTSRILARALEKMREQLGVEAKADEPKIVAAVAAP